MLVLQVQPNLGKCTETFDLSVRAMATYTTAASSGFGTLS